MYCPCGVIRICRVKARNGSLKIKCKGRESFIVEYITAFVVGGFICFIGQLMFDFFKFTPAHVMSSLVIIGALLDGFHLYDRLIDFAGAGALVPITSFGHSLVHGAMTEAEKSGFLGIGMGIFEVTSAGISSAILFGFLVALLFKPKG